MLRSTIEAGLNDLHVRLLESADLYGRLAGRHPDPSRAELFGELAARRRKRAERTESFIRRQGSLPDVPDTDWETLEELFTGAQQALGDDRAATDRVLEHENALAEAALRLLDEPVSGEVRQFLEELQLELRNARKRLDQAERDGTGPSQ